MLYSRAFSKAQSHTSPPGPKLPIHLSSETFRSPEFLRTPSSEQRGFAFHLEMDHMSPPWPFGPFGPFGPFALRVRFQPLKIHRLRPERVRAELPRQPAFPMEFSQPTWQATKMLAKVKPFEPETDQTKKHSCSMKSKLMQADASVARAPKRS